MSLWTYSSVGHPTKAGPLVGLRLEEYSSRILSRTGGMLHAFSIEGRAGAFSKDKESSRAFGRRLCDKVRREFNCPGFFTTDELPRYGLTVEDRGTIFRLYRKADRDRDVIVLMTYDRSLSERIRGFLLGELGIHPEQT